MATTARPFEVGAIGVRDSTGAVVASAKVRWYNPGTLVAATAYTDAACTTPATAPLTAGAGGQFTLYFLEPVRVIIKDSTETTTYYDDIAALNRHDSVYVTSPGFNSGNETTLETLLADLNTSTGGGVNVKPTSAATSRAIKAVLYERGVAPTDWAADITGVSDAATAFQAAVDYVSDTVGGGIVILPKGTLLLNSAVTIDTAGVSVVGVGRGVSILKNGSTSGNCLVVNLGSATDSKLFLRDFSITANTTSSGVALQVTNGDRIAVKNVSTALHRSGVITSAVTSPHLEDIWIESNDGNAASVGVNVGVRGRLFNSEVSSGTDVGTGVILSGTDSRCEDTYVNNFTTGVSLTGARAIVRGGHVNSATTGVSLGAAGTKARDVYVTGSTTGVSVGAFANCVVEGCDGSGNTLDLSVNASATLLREHNNFATITSTGATPQQYPRRLRRTMTTDASTTPSYTPVHDPNLVNVLYSSSGTTSAITLNDPVTTNAQPGDVLDIVLARAGGATNASIAAVGSLYRNPMDTAAAVIPPPGSGTGGRAVRVQFVWNGSVYIMIDANEGNAGIGWVL